MLNNLKESKFCDDFVFKIIMDFVNFLKYEKKYSINTIEAYLDDITNFLNYIYKTSNNIVDKNFLENISIYDYRNWLSDRLNNHSNNSNARALSSIRALFKFLNLNNLILKNYL